jgi:hypothetical protein
MTAHEAEQLLQQEVKGLDSYLDIQDYQNAVQKAQYDTGWTFPVTTNDRIYWILERAKRHLFFFLLSESAHKFKVKQYNLQHRFEHYRELIRDMDYTWEKYIEAVPDDSLALFGTKIDAGFKYDEDTGIDKTYGDDNLVIFHPTDAEV